MALAVPAHEKLGKIGACGKDVEILPCRKK
jgi:hypothetical protein